MTPQCEHCGTEEKTDMDWDGMERGRAIQRVGVYLRGKRQEELYDCAMRLWQEEQEGQI